MGQAGREAAGLDDLTRHRGLAQEALPMRVTAIRHLANECGHLEYKKPVIVPPGK